MVQAAMCTRVGSMHARDPGQHCCNGLRSLLAAAHERGVLSRRLGCAAGSGLGSGTGGGACLACWCATDLPSSAEQGPSHKAASRQAAPGSRPRLTASSSAKRWVSKYAWELAKRRSHFALSTCTGLPQEAGQQPCVSLRRPQARPSHGLRTAAACAPRQSTWPPALPAHACWLASQLARPASQPAG